MDQRVKIVLKRIELKNILILLPPAPLGKFLFATLTKSNYFKPQQIWICAANKPYDSSPKHSEIDCICQDSQFEKVIAKSFRAPQTGCSAEGQVLCENDISGSNTEVQQNQPAPARLPPLSWAPF